MIYGRPGIHAYTISLSHLTTKDEKGLPVKMERVESSIPIEDSYLDMTHMRERKGVGLGAIDLGKEGVVTH